MQLRSSILVFAFSLVGCADNVSRIDILRYTCDASDESLASPAAPAALVVDQQFLPLACGAVVVTNGKTTAARGPGWHAEIGEDAIAWCVEPVAAADGRGRCGVDPVPTQFGCQYFPEEGPADDLMVCILTILDGMCGGCISGCQGDECD